MGSKIKETFGSEGPDIIFDGMIDPAKLVEGKLPEKLGLFIENNEGATFANLDWYQVIQGNVPNISTDLSPHRGRLAALPRIVLPQSR